MLLHQKVFVLRFRDRFRGVISNNAQPLFVCFVCNSSSTGALGLTLNLNVTPAYPYQMTQTKHTCRENESESLFSTCNIPHVAQPSQLFAQISQSDLCISAQIVRSSPHGKKIYFLLPSCWQFPRALRKLLWVYVLLSEAYSQTVNICLFVCQRGL